MASCGNKLIDMFGTLRHVLCLRTITMAIFKFLDLVRLDKNLPSTLTISLTCGHIKDETKRSVNCTVSSAPGEQAKFKRRFRESPNCLLRTISELDAPFYGQVPKAFISLWSCSLLSFVARAFGVMVRLGTRWTWTINSLISLTSSFPQYDSRGSHISPTLTLMLTMILHTV